MRMPVLFIGHGNPMNAIEDNEFSAAWAALGSELSKPEAILSVSAHWETEGTAVTAMARPRTIHDFYGFPPALYEQQYPAPGSPGSRQADQDDPLRRQRQPGPGVGAGPRHMGRAQADLPAGQYPCGPARSLDRTRSPQAHYDLGQALSPLRDQGVLVLGSGNIVHNLRVMSWENCAVHWPSNSTRSSRIGPSPATTRPSSTTRNGASSPAWLCPPTSTTFLSSTRWPCARRKRPFASWPRR